MSGFNIGCLPNLAYKILLVGSVEHFEMQCNFEIQCNMYFEIHIFFSYNVMCILRCNTMYILK